MERCKELGNYCNEDGELCDDPLSCDKYNPVKSLDTITPRDFFAGCALIRDAIWCAANNEGWSSDECLIPECFRIAEAMMKQREVE